MGSSKKMTVGYWYHVAYHAGLCVGPIDAFLEFRGGDMTAWRGRATASSTISVNAPNLFGGEKDQGGIVGDVDLMFGEATQPVNPYIQVFATSASGSFYLPPEWRALLSGGLGMQIPPNGPPPAVAAAAQVPAWRGVSTFLFKGGKYGAMNPYPQKPAYKVEAIKAMWDCWYPEKAAIPLTPVDLESVRWRYLLVPHDDAADYSAPSVDDSAWPTGMQPFGSFHDAQSGYWTGVAAKGFPVGPGTEVGQNVKLWMRAEVYVASTDADLVYEAWKDNQMAMWFNGHLVINQQTQFGGYVSGTVDKSYLVPGKNSVVIMARDNESSPSSGNFFYIGVRVAASAGQNAMNPAHMLYYALTSPDMGRTPIDAMDDDSFRAGADWFYGERFGLCTTHDPGQESSDDFIARIGKVAGCSVNRSVDDGKWHLDIANGIYTLQDLPILTDDDILDFSEQPSTFNNAVNSMAVEFFDPAQKTLVTTSPLEAMALVNTFGRIHQINQYHEVPTSALALRVAERDLRADVTPTHGFDITTTRKTYNWRPNTYFRLQAPKRGIQDMVCILAEISTGTLKSGAIKITASQEIYSLSRAVFVDAEHGVDLAPPQAPVAITEQAAFEAPYIDVVTAFSRADLAALPADAGFLLTIAQDPARSVDYTIKTSVDGGSSYQGNATAGWCATALISEGDELADAAPATAFTLSGSIGAITSVVVGSAALWGDEIVRVDAIDAIAGTLTLGRGCADTVPAKHAPGSLIWFYDGAEGADGVEYTAGETIAVKLLTNTGSQQLAIAQATAMPLTFDQRWSRPYPPAGLKVNGAWYPKVISGDLALAWVQRDRVLQADQLVDTTQASIGPEAGVTASLRIYDENDVLLHTEAGLSGVSFDYATEIVDAGGTLGDPYYASVSAMLHLQGANGGTTFTDEKGTAWTPSGSPTTSTAQFKWGNSSGSFAGTSGYLLAADPMIGNFGSADFTVECWVYPKVSGGTQCIIGAYGNTDGRSWMLGISGSAISCAWSVSGSYEPSRDKGAAGLTIGAWQHLAMVRSGANLLAFIGGQLKGTFAMGTDVLSSMSGKKLKIGGNSENQWLNAYVQDIRITKGVARYTSAFTPPSAQFPDALPVGRLNGRLRIELESVRGGLASYQKHNVVVERAGYGFNYGKYYGGTP